MRFNRKKMTLLMKNKNFMKDFAFNWYRQSFRHYARDLDNIFLEDHHRRNVLLKEEKNLNDLVIRKVAYSVCCSKLYFD